jgi:hypothetical protein
MKNTGSVARKLSLFAASCVLAVSMLAATQNDANATAIANIDAYFDWSTLKIEVTGGLTGITWNNNPAPPTLPTKTSSDTSYAKTPTQSNMGSPGTQSLLGWVDTSSLTSYTEAGGSALGKGLTSDTKVEAQGISQSFTDYLEYLSNATATRKSNFTINGTGTGNVKISVNYVSNVALSRDTTTGSAYAHSVAKLSLNKGSSTTNSTVSDLESILDDTNTDLVLNSVANNTLSITLLDAAAGSTGTFKANIVIDTNATEVPSSVPEPSTLLLLGVGVGSLVLARRKAAKSA